MRSMLDIISEYVSKGNRVIWEFVPSIPALLIAMERPIGPEEQAAINEAIKQIEANGGYIVGAAPEERIYAVIIGRNFTVEYDSENPEVKADGAST